MDIKLGTQLYGPDATPSKREKMIRKANETTSSKLGMKICGMQVGYYILILSLLTYTQMLIVHSYGSTDV
jgi:hypothetical protein